MNKHCKVVVNATEITNEEWLEYRRQGLGGSDASIVAGINEYKSPYALWAEKAGIVESEFKGNKATEWGHNLERVVAEQYARETNSSVVCFPAILASLERTWQQPLAFPRLAIPVVLISRMASGSGSRLNHSELASTSVTYPAG